MIKKRALVLVSGGLDSATVMAIAKQRGFELFSLSFDYGQRHRSELVAAEELTAQMGVVEHRVAVIDLAAIGGSALTDSSLTVPEDSSISSDTSDIPVTYVPARNTIFLSYALALAEVQNINNIFIGVNAVDYSGYPDCRPEYIEAFEKMANLATRTAVEGQWLKIHTPLIKMSKSEIISVGVKLGVDYSRTVSCYQADSQGLACGRCDSCHLRKQGFIAASIADPTLYQ
ncbi:7-cyano-7-deazaguanine synthase [hydrothermal vent metagenome]|uniref:7-cyano-7-deazaguanine synthase n=1 Tax=hydrothermal vent metagenome TaxID=652676 RepID=A0A3B0XZ44_9ZZZZ